MKLLLSYFKTIPIFFLFFAFDQTNASTITDIEINHDGVILRGKVFVSEGAGIFPTVILLHGFPGGEGDVLGIGKNLAEAGINTLTFNYSGTHKSEGVFNLDNSQRNIETVFDFIHRSDNISKFKIDTTRIVLGGYSFGGGMAFTYAATHPEIKEVFSIAGNDHGAAFREYARNIERQRMLDEIFDGLRSRTEVVRFGAGGTPREIVEMQIIESNPTYDLHYCAPLLAQRRILLIAGWDDTDVSMEHRILPLYRALIKEKANQVQIHAVQDSHSFTHSKTELSRMIIHWLQTVEDEVE